MEIWRFFGKASLFHQKKKERETMKSKMNRALSMLFALVMVVTVFPVMTSTAAETKAQNVDVLSYEDIYVKDGLVMWLDGFDTATVTLPTEANKDSTGA